MLKMDFLANVIVIDDDEHLQLAINRQLEDNNINAKGFTSPVKALEYLKSNPDCHCIITDFKMEQLSGIELLKEVKKINQYIPVLIITAFSDDDLVIEALRAGAYDFIKKPIEKSYLIASVKRAVEKFSLLEQNKFLSNNIQKKDTYIKSLEDSLKEIKNSKYSYGDMVGKHPKMIEIYRLIDDIKDANTNVLITGESGTGKELIARAIHDKSNFKDTRFVAINCGALPENLIESELFGYEQGAFTGANKRKQGKFEYAENGTIFLDEIGELSLNLQSKLLRVLEERTFTRLGGNETLNFKGRILAATNKDLYAMVKDKTFREDLFYRLNVIEINVPPLRERKEDIILLTMHFIEDFNKTYKKEIRGISDALYNHLINSYWEGNVRELRNTIERLVVLSKADVLDYLGHTGIPPKESSDGIPLYYIYDDSLSMQENIDNIEKDIIKNALAEHNGNIISASKKLQVTRQTIYRKIKKFNIVTEM